MWRRQDGCERVCGAAASRWGREVNIDEAGAGESGRGSGAALFRSQRSNLGDFSDPCSAPQTSCTEEAAAAGTGVVLRPACRCCRMRASVEKLYRRNLASSPEPPESPSPRSHAGCKFHRPRKAHLLCLRLLQDAELTRQLHGRQSRISALSDKQVRALPSGPVRSGASGRGQNLPAGPGGRVSADR